MTLHRHDHIHTDTKSDDDKSDDEFDDEFDDESDNSDDDYEQDIESITYRRAAREKRSFWQCLYEMDCIYNDEQWFCVFYSIVHYSMMPPIPIEFDPLRLREQYRDAIHEYMRECADTHYPDFTFVYSEDLTQEQADMIGIKEPRISGANSDPDDQIVLPIPNESNREYDDDRICQTILHNYIDTDRLPPFILTHTNNK